MITVPLTVRSYTNTVGCRKSWDHHTQRPPLFTNMLRFLSVNLETSLPFDIDLLRLAYLNVLSIFP